MRQPQNAQFHLSLIILLFLVMAHASLRAESSLYNLMMRGDADAVQKWVAEHPGSVNAPVVMWNSTKTPLQIAVETGYEKIARILIDNGAKLDDGDASGNTALHIAAGLGRVVFIDMLLKHGAAVNPRNDDGATPLAAALEHRQAAAAKRLIELGADVMVPVRKTGMMPFMIALKMRLDSETIQALLDKNAFDPAYRDNNENSALTFAIMGENEDVIRELLERGADLKSEVTDHPDLLAYVIQKKNMALTAKLLDAGADVNYRDDDGGTPLSVAVVSGDADIVNVLLEKGADVSSENEDGNSVLYAAIHNGARDVAKLLIAYHADVNARSQFSNQTPLIIAARDGKRDIAEDLLQAGADINAKDATGYSAVIHAIINGHTDIARMLLENHANLKATGRAGLKLLKLTDQGEGDSAGLAVLLEHGADPAALDDDGWSLLHSTALKGRVVVMKSLIVGGVDVNRRDRQGQTALLIAVNMMNPDMAALLLEHGADPNIADSNNMTPLGIAVKMDRLDIIRLLIDHGAAVDGVTHGGNTALHIAAVSADLRIIQALVDAGADVNAVNERAMSPWDVAHNFSRRDIVAWLEKHGARSNLEHCICEIISRKNKTALKRLLANVGADRVNAINARGRLPLVEAVSAGDLEVIGLLLDHGAVIEKSDSSGHFPLFVAVSIDRADIVAMLLKRGANPNIVDSKGRTPLSVALDKRRDDIIPLLLDHDADPNTADKNGDYPLYIAVRRTDVAAVGLLLKYGAAVNSKDRDGMTPMGRLLLNELEKSSRNRDASRYDNADVKKIARMLFDAGADVSQTVKSSTPKRSVLEMIVELGFGDIVLDCIEKRGVLDTAFSSGRQLLCILAEAGDLKSVRAMIEKGASVNVSDPSGYTPLMAAAGNPEILALLLNAGADVSRKNKAGKTALFYAWDREDRDSMMRLLRAGADPNIYRARDDRRRKTLLHDAADNGDVELARVLIERGSPVNLRNHRMLTPLDYALRSGSRELVDLLKENGAVRGIHEKRLLDAIRRSNVKQVATYLELGADVSAIDIYGRSLLSDVVIYTFSQKKNRADVKIIESLIQHGAEVNPIGRHVDMPLDQAVKLKRWDIADLLRRYGAVGRSPGEFRIACLSQNIPRLKIMRRIFPDFFNLEEPSRSLLLRDIILKDRRKTLRFLADCGVNFQFADENGDSQLHFAARCGDPDVMRLLIRSATGETVNAVNRTGWTPLHTAVRERNPQIVCLLLDAGASPNIADANGWRPLHLAAWLGDAHSATLLLNAGADPAAKTTIGQTPAAIAEAEGFDALAAAIAPKTRSD